MTEQAFWKRFLASEFFHRSRTGGRSQLTPYDDIFDRCLQEEDDENSKPPPMSRMDKIRFDIDLSTTAEDHMESGNAPDFTMKPGREAQSLPLIRRFNKHSSRVLETLPSKSKPVTTTFEQDVEKDTIMTELLEEPAPEKIILDIQDTRRYFESQTGGIDETKMSEDVIRIIFVHLKPTHPLLKCRIHQDYWMDTTVNSKYGNQKWQHKRSILD